MAYRKEDMTRVVQAFAHKRNEALGRAKARMEALYREHPEFREIDSALAKTGMRLVEEVLKGKEGITERVAAVRAENEALQKDRADLLALYGYAPDHTEVQYECPLCNDTGYTGEKMCLCMKKALAQLGLERSGLAPLARTQSFDTFDLKYYRDGDRATMEKNLSFCRQYAEKFSPLSPSLLFLGKTGLGKTHLSTSIAAVTVEKGTEVIYCSAPRLFLSLSDEKFGRAPLIPSADIHSAELLIIDDLGTENPSDLNVNFLYSIVNTRIVSGKPTIINTNLTVKEIKERYTDRIASRLLGEYIVLPFVGSDIRMQKIGL